MAEQPRLAFGTASTGVTSDEFSDLIAECSEVDQHEHRCWEQGDGNGDEESEQYRFSVKTNHSVTESSNAEC